MRTLIVAALMAAAVLSCPTADAAGTGFDPRIVTFGETREQIKATPIEQRPYRPLHVYGNSLRRRHSRPTR
ncbi:MAG: hypothetical protein ACKONH_11885 [Planctomycetia bacterium]